MTWQPHDDLIPLDVMHSAVADTRAGRYDDALRKFLWFHEASRDEIGMEGVRLSFALGYWMDLAARFPPAKAAFIQLRDKMEARCRAHPCDCESFHDLFALNQHLHADGRTVELFWEIADNAPNHARILYSIVEELLVAEGKYHACAPYLEWQKRVEHAISGYVIGMSHEKSRANDDIRPPPFARRHFQREMTRLVALLVLNGRREEAAEVCDRCLEILYDDDFRNTLLTALSGRFPPDDSVRTDTL